MKAAALRTGGREEEARAHYPVYSEEEKNGSKGIRKENGGS